MAQARTSDVVAFRLGAHHLIERQRGERLLAVAGACGVQNSPPGSALLALAARTEDVTQERFDRLVGADKSLLQTWCMRGSPYLFPTDDAAVFTAGVLPVTESGRLQLIAGVEPALRQLGMGLDATVDLIAEAIGDVLTGQRLAIDELGRALADRITGRLGTGRRDEWCALGPYAADQPLGEAVVHFCLRILTLRGVVCMAAREENRAPFVLVDEWLGHPIDQGDPEQARASLLRRYLHCYGPSTRADFAAWLGVRSRDVDPWWDLLVDELRPVDLDGRQTWILDDDEAALRSPSEVRGVRLLPPSDPYLQVRDRVTIVEKEHHREVWQTSGGPGVVLADGSLVGTWRPRKSARTLTLTVTPFISLSARMRRELADEADRMAAVRGATTVQVTLMDGASTS